MGVFHNLFIGPYAEFRVPPGQVERFPPQDEDEEMLCWENLQCVWGEEDRHVDCYQYIPAGKGSKQPARTMYAGDKGGASFPNQDLTDVDRQDEMGWFAKKYAKELRLLAERYRTPPAIRWGILCWYS